MDRDLAHRCFFCGATEGLTREHLLPDWLPDVLPAESEPVMHFRQIGKDPAERREWLRRPFRERSHVACGDCNHHWMSDLETAASKALAPLVRHEPSWLGAEAQSLAAGWAFKTCLVLQASQTDEPMAPRAHFETVRLRSRPPKHQVTVWISSNYRGREGQLHFEFLQRPLTLTSIDGRVADEDQFGYLNYLTVGALGFLLVGHRFANRTEVEYTGFLREAMANVWPDASGVVRWPPAYMMDRDFIDTLTLEGVGSFETRVWPGPAPND